jgi:predicted SAM-dependent methyltransferase
MAVRQLLKRSQTLVGLVLDVRRLRGARTRSAGRRRRMIERYLASTRSPRLQVGAGPTSRPGWLSTDLAPTTSEVVYLDATQPFPFDDGTFDYVYSEHMIEHVPWPAGRAMLRECARVLKPTGRLRIATPDLSVILGLHGPRRDAVAERYIRWISDRYLAGVPYNACFVINNAFRNWGHQFLYDAELLESALGEAGFGDIKRYAVGESDDVNLRDLESHGDNVDDREMVAFETMVFEARPAA